MNRSFTRRAGLLWAASAWPLAAAAFDFSDLGARRGSGRMAARTVELTEFDAIEVSGGLVLTLHQAKEARVTIDGDDNLLAQIDIVQKGRSVHLSSKGHIAPTRLSIAVQVWKLEDIHANGSARVEADTLVAKRLAVRLGGSAVVRFAALTAEVLNASTGGSAVLKVGGQANELEASLGGSSVLEASALQVRRASVSVGGSGVAKVWAVDTLSGSVGGSGLVRYRGEPQLSVATSGSGRVRKA